MKSFFQYHQKEASAASNQMPPPSMTRDLFNENPTRKSRLNVAIVFLIFFASLAHFAPLSLTTPKGYPTFYDEGSAIHASQRIARGEHLYRDMLYFKGPLSYYGLGSVFHVFGASLAHARLAGTVVLSLVMVLTVLLTWELCFSSRPVSSADKIFTALVVWIPAMMVAVQRLSWHNSWCVCSLALASVLLCLRAVRSGGESIWVLTGVAGGLTFLTKQSFGLWLAAGMIIQSLVVFSKGDNRQPCTNLLLFFGGASAILICWVLWASMAGSLENFWLQAVLYPLKAHGFADGLYHALPLPGWNITALVFYGPPVFLSILAVLSLQKRGTVEGKSSLRSVWTYSVLVLCLYGALFPRADMGHLRPLIPLALPSLGLLLFGVGKKMSPSLRKGAAIAVVIGLIIGLGVMEMHIQRGRTALVASTAGGVSVDQKIARELNDLTAYIQSVTHQQDPIFVVPWAPLVYFLADRPNPTRMRILWPGQWDGDAYLTETIECLENARVQTIVWVDGLEKIHGRHFQDYAPAMHQYIVRYFKPARRIGRFVIMQRRNPADMQ